MAAPYIDLTRSPLVTVTFRGLPTDEEFDEYLAGMTRLILDRRLRTVTILDARNSGRTSPVQRRKQAEWLKEQDHLLRRYSLGTAFVISSPVVRGVLTAIFWVQKLPTDHCVVATLAEAEKWAAERLRAAGLDAPAAPPTINSPLNR